MTTDQRLIQLEEKIAHLEKYLGDLDEVVRELAGNVRKQGEGVEQVRKMLADHLSDQDDPGDQKPPHW